MGLGGLLVSGVGVWQGSDGPEWWRSRVECQRLVGLPPAFRCARLRAFWFGSGFKLVLSSMTWYGMAGWYFAIETLSHWTESCGG